MKSIEDVLQRNNRVEMDKAWEVSYTRRLIIAGIIYLVAAAFMKSISLDAYLLSALVPTGGYLFSTLSLPIVKKYWIEKYGNK